MGPRSLSLAISTLETIALFLTRRRARIAIALQMAQYLSEIPNPHLELRTRTNTNPYGTEANAAGRSWRDRCASGQEHEGGGRIGANVQGACVGGCGYFSPGWASH